MREIRAITETVRGVFDARGYGEVATPALEYETTLARGDAAAAEPAYRLFDESGNVLVLRSDMTIPIARVVATRYATSEPPLRFCYFAHAYRSVRPQRGQAREMLQAGIELVGAPGPGRHGRGDRAAVRGARQPPGLDSYRVGLGDASLYPALLDALGVPEAARGPILHELVTRDFVGLEREIEGLRLGDEARTCCCASRSCAAGPRCWSCRRARRPTSSAGSSGCTSASRRAWRSGSSSTSGCRASLGYYTGAIFEVYDAALGVPLGGGGRYDDLLGALRARAAGRGLGAERRAAPHRAGRRGERGERWG